MRIPLLLLCAMGCPTPDETGDTGEPADTGETGETGETGDTGDSGSLPLGQDDFIDVSEPLEGDLSCVGAVAAEPEAVCVVEQTLEGVVHDFQTEDPVQESDWSLWLSDIPSGSADATGTADSDGRFVATAPTCSPLTFGTSTPEAWEETVPTYVQHSALAYGHIGLTSVTLPAVSYSTARLIPALLGVEWTEGTGLVVATVVGCDGAPVGKAQAYLHDGTGGAPAEEEVFYFARGLPSSTATSTNGDDGAVLVMGVTAGSWTLSGFAFEGGLVEIGSAPVTVVADAVTVVSLVVGRDDGVNYPDICFMPCDEID